MKKLILILVCMLTVIAGSFAAYIVNGKGKTYTVTTAITSVELSPAGRQVSIYNAGATSNILWVGFNCTSQEFAIIVADTDAIPIRGGQSYTTPERVDINSLCFRASAGSFDIDMAAY